MDFDGQEMGTIYGPMVSDGAYFYALESEYRTADGDGGGEPEFFREKSCFPRPCGYSTGRVVR